MEIFITGATRVLGRPVIQSLVAQGHRVRALSRSGTNEAEIRALGAIPMPADLFDVESLKRAVAGCNAIAHLATKIPPTMKMGKTAAWLENDRIRREGTRNLVEAALASGSVETVVFESFGLVYPDSGDKWVDAATTPVQPAPTLISTFDGEKAVQRFAEAGHRGISLRLGLIYGPESPSALEQLSYMQKGIAAFPGSSDAFLPQIWVQDAASAFVAALLQQVPSGVYDIADDNPLTRHELFEAIAAAAGKKRYFSLPVPIMKMLAGVKYDDICRSQRVSNRRFKEVSNWTPSVSDSRIGWKRMAEKQRAEASV
ncbi:MAG TPA: NAD(P)-dependent oxidoreductase [Ktedonobacteraceae bacterium]|nr:NAD(P)-dependent oxidoreductase [Ktedonobacteraceae bacterium]